MNCQYLSENILMPQSIYDHLFNKRYVISPTFYQLFPANQIFIKTYMIKPKYGCSFQVYMNQLSNKIVDLASKKNQSCKTLSQTHGFALIEMAKNILNHQDLCYQCKSHEQNSVHLSFIHSFAVRLNFEMKNEITPQKVEKSCTEILDEIKKISHKQCINYYT